MRRKMQHQLKNDFLEIVKRIVNENKTIHEWIEIESSDMFQDGAYVGGFDGIEEEFCFSVYIADIEYWFQLSLEEIKKVDREKGGQVEIRMAD